MKPIYILTQKGRPFGRYHRTREAATKRLEKVARSGQGSLAIVEIKNEDNIRYTRAIVALYGHLGHNTLDSLTNTLS